MRLLTRVAVPTFLMFSCLSAHAEGLKFSDGSCLMFCNSTPEPTPTPSPAAQSDEAAPTPAPVAHHHPKSASKGVETTSAVGHGRGKTPLAKKLASRATRSGSAAQPNLALASHAQAAIARQAATTSAAQVPLSAPPETAPPASILEPASNTAAGQNESQSSAPSDDDIRLLAKAFSERSREPRATDLPLDRPEVAAMAPTPETSPTVLPAKRAALTEIFAKGLVVLPRWPATLPGRTGVWLAGVAVLASLGFGGAKAHGRLHRPEA